MSVWGPLSLDFPYSVIYQQEGKRDGHRFCDQPYNYLYGLIARLVRLFLLECSFIYLFLQVFYGFTELSDVVF